MKTFIDGIEVISVREAAAEADVTTNYIYMLISNTDSPFVVKTNGKRKFITLESFTRWNKERTHAQD